MESGVLRGLESTPPERGSAELSGGQLPLAGGQTPWLPVKYSPGNTSTYQVRKCFPECLFDHVVSLWPSPLTFSSQKIKSLHLCPQMHRCYKFGEIPTSGLQDVALMNFWYIITDARTDCPITECLQHRSNAGGVLKNVKSAIIQKIQRKYNIMTATAYIRMHGSTQRKNRPTYRMGQKYTAGNKKKILTANRNILQNLIMTV